MNQRHAYKLYNPIRKKVIISKDVQFVEDEAWDGTLDKIIDIVANIPKEEDEDFASAHTSNVIPPTPIQGQQLGQMKP